MKKNRVCLVPKVSGVGGMVSFRRRLEAGLSARGYEISYDLAEPGCSAVLVIGGTRAIGGLWRARRRGVRIIQRLNGMNWLHRVRKGTPLRHYLRAEYGNFILRTIRSQLAHGIVYQSEFSRAWWERIYGITTVPCRVVYNGVDLSVFTPESPYVRSTDCCRLLLVEGSLMGGYETGLESAVGLATGLAQQATIAQHFPLGVELVIVGRAPEQVRRDWEGRAGLPILWAGQAPPDKIPEIDRSAHLLYSADLHPACPNSVIEALACGLPVAAFETGALPELVTGDSGRIVPYGGDPWRLEPPDIPTLVEAAQEILTNQDRFRRAARARAEEAFGIDRMVVGYLEALFE